MTIRVVHIVESFDHTGAGRQVAMLAAGLPREEFDVHVCSLGLTGPLENELADRSIGTNSLDRRWLCDPAAFWRLRRYIARLAPDVVHTWQFAANAYGRLAGGRNGSRLVATERRVDLWKRWPEERLDRMLLPRTTRLVATCQTVRDFYLLRPGFWRPERLTVIPPGVQPPPEGHVSRETLLEEFDLPEDAILVAAAGSLTHDKRGKDLIWAVEILASMFPNIHLLLIGDGPQRRPLERFASCLQRGHLVHFLGCRDARVFWPHVDMLWHAGEEDGVSMAMLEAMAAGIAVVASDTPANREVVLSGETGLLFPLGDRAGLARCARKLLQQRELARQLGVNARRRVADDFDATTMVDRHAAMYREIIDA